MFDVLQPGDPAVAPPAAPVFLRLAAASIDLVIVSVLFFAAGNYWGKEVGPARWHVTGLPACGLIFLLPAYWLIPEMWFDGTLGKLMVGLRVFSLAGSPLTGGQVVKRNVAKLIELSSLYFVSAIVAFSNPLRQTVGDLWAKTMVTRASALSTWRHGPGAPDFGQWLKSFPKPDTVEASPRPEGPVA